MRRISIALFAVPFFAVAFFAPSASAQSPSLSPCEVRGLSGTVLCGTVRVPEDRDRPNGRMLVLNLVVARSTEPNPAPDPFMLLAGGPGQAGTEMGGFATDAFSEVRKRRDIILIDARGTGRSNGLACALAREARDYGSSTLYPSSWVRFCRDSLARHADLGQYTTANIADDIEAVRRAFGWPQLNLYGTSYGTRVAFVFLQRHPASVRSLVLKAIVPPGMVYPMNYARDSERALSLLERDCRADAACARAVPSVRAALDSTLALAAAGRIREPLPGTSDTVTIERDLVASMLMSALQSAGQRAQIPAMLQSAAGGQTRPLAEFVLTSRRLFNTFLATGMHLSVSCSDDGRHLDVRKAREDDGRTFLGSARVRMMAEACGDWPLGTETPRVFQPTRSNVPVLLVSGELDPNTPPSGGELALRSLPNARHVVLRGVAHGWSNVTACGSRFVADFVERASVRDLDVRCGAVSSAPAFVIPR